MPPPRRYYEQDSAGLGPFPGRAAATAVAGAGAVPGRARPVAGTGHPVCGRRTQGWKIAAGYQSRAGLAAGSDRLGFPVARPCRVLVC